MDLQHERLNFLLQQYADKTLTESEKDELSGLLMHDWNKTGKQDQEEQMILQKVDWEKMVQEILETRKPARMYSIGLFKNSWFKYAAAILIILSVGLYLSKDKTLSPKIANTATVATLQNDVFPGSNKAILTLADGTTINLDSAAKGTLAKQGNSTVIKTGDGQLVYAILSSGGVRGVSNEAIGMNTMTAPRGGQYRLVLPDGTKVWLNAESSITYPTAFKGKNRTVSMTGEAYFEVTKNPDLPFIVNTSTDEITVLGTSFNVNSYANEVNVKTSLLEGSVRIQKQLLKPGEAYINGKVMATNIEQDLAWKNGFFSFNKADLPAVMRQLSRWYDVEVSYEGAIPKRAFSGEIGRSLTLRQVLEVLSQTRIKYRIEQNNRIIIMS